MNHYNIQVKGINGFNNNFMVTFHRKPMVHEAWVWLEKKLGERICYMNANTLFVNEITIEEFEV